MVKWIFLVLFSSAAFSQSKEIEDCEDIICWDQNRKLEWSDFKAVPDFFMNSVGIASAATVARIQVKSNWVQGRLIFQISNKFIKTESWVRDTVPTENLLQHEQLHFDIAELYTRKIREKVLLLGEEGIENVGIYEDAIRSLLKERHALGEKYDNETAHGLLKEKQGKWNEKIYEELIKLKEYSSSEEECNCLP